MVGKTRISSLRAKTPVLTASHPDFSLSMQMSAQQGSGGQDIGRDTLRVSPGLLIPMVPHASRFARFQSVTLRACSNAKGLSRRQSLSFSLFKRWKIHILIATQLVSLFVSLLIFLWKRHNFADKTYGFGPESLDLTLLFALYLPTPTKLSLKVSKGLTNSSLPGDLSDENLFGGRGEGCCLNNWSLDKMQSSIHVTSEIPVSYDLLIQKSCSVCKKKKI